ncbi:hypothetical protein [Vibrio variabilis]|uniref:hypothetical protein n=1 Tax=Vibrio variabilis TaxID=990271 RepID=UPI0013A708F9|nr:hypothetical protein [Vibrio variabilis]
MELGGVAGIYSDGSGGAIEGAVWRSLNPSVAVIEGGNVKALAVGNVTVEVSFGGLTSSKSYTVVKADLEDIRFTGLPESLAAGLTLNLPTVFGRFSDGSEKPITDQVTWKSSDTSVAAITSHQIKALKPGLTTLTASYQGKEHTYNLAIGEAEITDIALNIDASDFNKGEQLPLEVLATLTDGTTKVISEGVTWTVSDETVLGVSDMTLVAKAEGTATLTAKLKDTVAPTVEITVLPPTVASMSPDLLDGTLTLTEGETISMDIIVEFSDGTKETFNEVIFDNGNYYESKDESGIELVKVNTSTRTMRAIRSGENSNFKVRFNSDRLKELFELYVSGQETIRYNYALVPLTIVDNPNVYQWHRIDFTKIDSVVSADANEAQTIVSEDTVYRFWNVPNGHYHDIYVGKIDKNGVSEYKKVIENRFLVNNHLIDGGGNGYYILVSQLSTDHRTVQVYDLKSGSLSEPLKISADQFNSASSTIWIDDHRQSAFVDSNGTPVVADFDNDQVTVYRYNKVDETWVPGAVVKGYVEQMPTYPDHIVVVDRLRSSPTEQTLPTYHFINKDNGTLEKSVTMVGSASMSKTCNHHPQLVPLDKSFNFAAFCEYSGGYHIWSDITHEPSEITVDPAKGEELNSCSNIDAVAGVLPNGNIFGQRCSIKVNGERLLQVNELNPLHGETTITRLDLSGWKAIEHTNKYKFRVSESTRFGQKNPHLDNEWVQLFGMGVGVYTDGKWHIDREMYDTPTVVDSFYSLIKSQNTWYILLDQNVGREIWYFQHRNPTE